MSGPYVPGTPNPYFSKHKYFGIPLNRNIQPVSQVAVTTHSGPDGAVRQAVEVEILTAEHLWATFQAEAEDLLRVSGSLDGNEEERNRRINAAYARLWLADNRFQWAGLAAFASKQVGCGLLHAADVVARNRQAREQVQLSAAAAMPGAEAAVGIQATAEAGAAYMRKQLGFGNKHLFLDIYPLHRFFMERGWDEFKTCLPKRQNKKYAVHWDIPRTTLPFAVPFEEIYSGFERVDKGELKTGVQLLARHEQANILQKIMYDDWYVQRLLAMNQCALVTGIFSGDAERIELTLSAQCKARKGITTLFSAEKSAKLWVVEQRMPFVLRAADQFDKLLTGPERTLVEASIRAVAAGGGVA